MVEAFASVVPRDTWPSFESGVVDDTRSIHTFPRRDSWRTPRLLLPGCPVYFFPRAQCDSLMREAGFSQVKIDRVGQIYCVLGQVCTGLVR